jgi:DNA-3-methyladenine glycosylase II
MFTDPILQKLIKLHGPHEFEDKSERLMEELIEAIISQQLSIKAADTIYSRFLGLFKDKKYLSSKQNLSIHNKQFPTAEQILNTETEKLRSAGMSYSKAGYIKNIAKAFADGELNIKKIKKMTDEEVIIELTKIKGVGKWTAEMILIFTLKREDVFSLGDAGIKRAIKNLYKLTDEKEILKLSKTWRPHRSLACWYLWRSLNNIPIKY